MNRRLAWLLKSRAYRNAKRSVASTLKKPEALRGLIARANEMLATRGAGPLADVAESIRASLRLIRCYVNGDYRDVSIETIGLLVASLTYLVMPLDLLPDFILGLGLSDDFALLAWTFKSVAEELRRFTQWEQQQAQQQESTPDQEALNADNPRLEDHSEE